MISGGSRNQRTGIGFVEPPAGVHVRKWLISSAISSRPIGFRENLGAGATLTSRLQSLETGVLTLEETSPGRP